MADAKAKGAEAVSVDKPKGPSVSYAAPVAEQKALAKGGNLEGALANLLQLEKTARLVRAPCSPPGGCCGCSSLRESPAAALLGEQAAAAACSCLAALLGGAAGAVGGATGGGAEPTVRAPSVRLPRAFRLARAFRACLPDILLLPHLSRNRRAATSRGRPSWSLAWSRCATTRRTFPSSARP